MTARAISREAYHEFLDSGRAPAQWHILFATIRSDPGCTRSELAEMTGLRVASVCGRINELAKAGLVMEGARRPCSTTQRTATTIWART